MNFLLVSTKVAIHCDTLRYNVHYISYLHFRRFISFVASSRQKLMIFIQAQYTWIDSSIDSVYNLLWISNIHQRCDAEQSKAESAAENKLQL